MTKRKAPKATTKKPTCQLCTEAGHTAERCPWRHSPTPLLSALMAPLQGRRR
jgi:hypothetical protein